MVAVTLLSGHVAPSVDDNNRYLKVTPLADRVRLAYTVFFGEVPGASERRGIDTNKDGRIDDAEAKAFAQKIAAQVAAALVVEIDGKVWPVVWDTVDAGMGTPVVAAGSFSIDLVAYACAGGKGRHRMLVKDRFRVPHPGETEVKVEDGPPGVTIEKAHVGAADDPTWDYRFAGPGGPVEDDGLEVVWFDDKDVTGSACRPPEARSGSGSGGGIGLWIGIGVGAGVGIAIAFLVWLRRDSQREGS